MPKYTNKDGSLPDSVMIEKVWYVIPTGKGGEINVLVNPKVAEYMEQLESTDVAATAAAHLEAQTKAYAEIKELQTKIDDAIQSIDKRLKSATSALENTDENISPHTSHYYRGVIDELTRLSEIFESKTTDRMTWEELEEDYMKDEYPVFGGPFTDAKTEFEWLKLHFEPPTIKKKKCST